MENVYIFTSLVEAEDRLRQHETEKTLRYVKWKSPKGFGSLISYTTNNTERGEEHSDNGGPVSKEAKRKGEKEEEGLVYDVPDVIKMLNEEEDTPDESDYFVDAETAYGAAMIRASVIISADKKNRHGRELFMARSNCFRLGGRSKYYGYGYGVFSFQARECVEIHLKKKFLKYSGIYITNVEILGLRDNKLLKMFQEDRILAEIYLSEVLTTEGLAAIFQSVTKCPYEDADEELKKFQNKSKFKAQKDAIVKVGAIKKELEKKYNPLSVNKTSLEDDQL